MPNKYAEQIESLQSEIERLKSEIDILEVSADSHIHGFETLKKFMTVLFDETFPQEKMDVICNSDKITNDEIIEAFQFLEIDCEVK